MADDEIVRTTQRVVPPASTTGENIVRIGDTPTQNTPDTANSSLEHVLNGIAPGTVSFEDPAYPSANPNGPILNFTNSGIRFSPDDQTLDLGYAERFDNNSFNQQFLQMYGEGEQVINTARSALRQGQVGTAFGTLWSNPIDVLKFATGEAVRGAIDDAEPGRQSIGRNRSNWER